MLKRQLNDWIEAYLTYTKNSEPPRMFRLWSSISVIAAVLQRKCKLSWGSLTFYPNMYVILVARSGEARKGTAMDQARFFLDELGTKMAAEAITREALIRELKNSSDNTIDHETGKTTYHSSLTIWAQELAVFLGYYNHQLLSDLTDWYDCRSKWTYRTKTMGTDEIIGVYVNMLGATTPELIRTTMPMDAIGGGLTSRMIFIYEPFKGKLVSRPFLTNAEIGLGRQLMIDLEQMQFLTGEFGHTEGFMEAWDEWYIFQASNPPFQDLMFSGYIQRRPSHIMKLSMILNASRSNAMMLEKEDLARALDILVLAEEKMLQTFSGVGKSGHADTLEQVMTEIGLCSGDGIRFSRLMEIFHRDADKWTMDKILETLEAMDFAVVIKSRDPLIVHKDSHKAKKEKEDGNNES